jgi:hypothetical protein
LVTIKPANDALGHVQYPRPSWLGRHQGPSMKQCFSEMICCLAGYIAERRAGYQPRKRRASEDTRSAVSFAFEYSEGDSVDARLWLRLAERHARRLIDVRWYQIEAVAAALIERETLGRTELLAVMEEAILSRGWVFRGDRLTKRPGS